MLITRFHTIIRNKIVWGVFAVLVCVSFIATDISMNESGCTARNDQERVAEGRIGDDYITPRDFLMARYHELGLREPRELTDSEVRDLRAQTWRRLAALRAARNFDIQVNDGELSDMIRQDRSFSDGGQFSPARYRQLVENQLHVTVDTFEAFLREEIILRKLRSFLEASVWISPDEVERRLTALTDTFTLDVIRLEPDKGVRKLKASADDARAYYVANTNAFRIPETRRVLYVEFPADLTPSDTNLLSVTEDEILAFYDDNVDRYSVTDTNGTSITTPLESVRDEIQDTLRHRKAIQEARNRAGDFVMRLGDRVAQTNFFRSFAAELGFPLGTSAYFTVMGNVAGLEVGPQFPETAFGLDPADPERSYSDTVPGSNAVYVLAIDDVRPPRIPAFEEIVDTVMPFAVSNVQQQAFLKQAGETRERLVSLMGDGKAFSDSVRKLDLNVYTSLTCSVFSGLPEDFPYASDLSSELPSLKKNTVSEPLRTEDGCLLVYVSNREPGDFANAQMLRPQVIATLDRYRAGVLYPQWCDFTLAYDHFEDLVATREQAAAAAEAAANTN